MVPISVVVTVFNGQEALAECLDTILGQTLPDFELVCVDDGSTDSSPQILAEYAERDSRVSIITQPNMGLSHARNTGFDATRGDYVLFLDADDFYEPTYFERARAQAEADDADIVIVKFRYVRDGGALVVETPGSLRTDLLPEKVPFGPLDVRGSLFRLTTPAAWNKLFKRKFLLKEGLRFDTSLTRAEDLAFTFGALMLAQRISVVNETMVNYRTGNEGSVQSTIHRDPLAICRALEVVRGVMIRNGLFDSLEQDLVNVCVAQCLFSLGSLRTVDAAQELFESLKSHYLMEFGATNRDASYFYSRSDYDRLRSLLSGTFGEYWFQESRRLSAELLSTSAKLGAAYSRLDVARGAAKSHRIRTVERAEGSELLDPSREQTIRMLMTRAQSLSFEVRDVSYEILERRAKLEHVLASQEAATGSRLYRALSWVFPPAQARNQQDSRSETEK